MASNINYIPQIDYTSRDYTSVRQDLLALINQLTPSWKSTDPSDLGMTLVELFAYMGDLLNFYIDRAANEGFIATASQRDSLLQIAAMLGYIPKLPTAATAALTFSNISNASVTVPAGTQVATSMTVDGTSTQIIFETDASVSVPAISGATPGTAVVSATQGYTVSAESVGISAGTANQVFKLSEAGVIGGSISASSNNITYTYVPSLIDYTSTDYVFTATSDAYGNTYVIFGDGINGKIPASSLPILVTYRVGVGAAGGGLPAGTLKSIINDSLAGITVLNTGATVGGSDAESTDSIRVNAPRALRTLTRAVSLRDYAYLALQVPEVGKAVADGSSFNSVILYISPTGDTGVISVPITAISGSGSVVTYTVPTGHGLNAGQYVTITGSTTAAYNLTNVAIASVTSTTFTVSNSATGDTSTAVATGVATGNVTSAFSNAATKVATYFTDKIAPSTTLTVLPPTYVPVDISMTVHVLPQYQQAAVVTQTASALSEVFAASNVFFADTIPVQYVMGAVSAVPGVDYVTVESLRRHGNDQSFTSTGYSRSGYTVTLTTASTADITVGQTVKVATSGGNSVTDGTWVVSAVVANTSISYVTTTTGTTSGSTAATVQVQAVEVVTCATNEIPALGTLTQTGVGGIQ